MKKIRQFCTIVALSTMVALMGGCASKSTPGPVSTPTPSPTAEGVKEAALQFMEPNLLELQVNRAAVGMAYVRINNMLAEMDLSSDAKWPILLAENITDEQSEAIKKGTRNDPYLATHTYTDAKQIEIVGGPFITNISEISPLTEKVYQRIVILYGEDSKNWPDLYTFSADMSNFDAFSGEATPKKIEAPKGDRYDNVGSAVVALMPINYKKDLELMRKQMRKAMGEAIRLNGEKSELETRLKEDEAKQADHEPGYKPLTEAKKRNINEQIAALEVRIETAETEAEEKKQIYFGKLDEAVEALKSDIKLDDEQVGLANNIVLVCDQIEEGAADAWTMFGIAIGNLSNEKVWKNIGTEVKSFTLAKVNVPKKKQKMLSKRIARITKNTVYLIPTVTMGSYYALEQAAVAEKYRSVAQIVVDADTARKEEIAEAKRLKEEEAKRLKEEEAAAAKADKG